MHVLRQLNLPQGVSKVANEDTDDHCANEAGTRLGTKQVSAVRKVGADERRGKCGLATNGLCNPRAHDGNHEREAQRTNGVEHPRYGCNLAIGRLDVGGTKLNHDRADGHEKAAANHERQSSGNTSHQVVHEPGHSAGAITTTEVN